MSSIASAGGPGGGMSPVQFEAQYQAAAIKKQMDVENQMGDMALQLIQSASMGDPAIGRQLNVLA